MNEVDDRAVADSYAVNVKAPYFLTAAIAPAMADASPRRQNSRQLLR